MLKLKSTCCLFLRKKSQIEASPKEIVVFVWEFCFPVERAAVNSISFHETIAKTVFYCRVLSLLKPHALC